MRRGTTPTITITTDMDLTEATVLYLTLEQGNVTIEKSLSDVTVTSNTVSCTLTQEETLTLSASNILSSTGVYVQIRAKFSDGTAVASNIMLTTVGAILKDGEI